MNRPRPVILVLAAALFLGVGPAEAEKPAVLVELFTSQGCSSCPPADALLRELAHRPDILALAYHVDYWDRLGWKDPFSSPEATLRQRHYAALLGLGTVYTPQIVVDGRFEAVGSDREAVAAAIAKAGREPPSLSVTLAFAPGRARIAIGAGAVDESAAVVLVGYDRRHTTDVERGENGGRRLTDVDVVRGIARVGIYAGAATTIEAAVPWHSDRLAAIVAAPDGRVLGVAAGPARRTDEAQSGTPAAASSARTLAR